MIGGLIALAILGGLGFAVWSALGGALDPAERSSLDAARVVKSAAIATGMYWAMIAISVGLIDLLQVMVGGSRISGSNSDLARGLSLLIVATPVAGVLARVIDQQRQQRQQRQTSGDHRPAIGWSIHLVGALTTTLLGVLVSTSQIIDDWVSSSRDVSSAEVAQLVGWLAMWLTYWFGLRPRFGVRSSVHLFFGTAAGLSWFVIGSAGLGVGILSDAYNRLFSQPLADSYELTQWIAVAVVGAIVWGWHWRAFNSDAGLEHGSRRSTPWFALVVGVAIVPAVIMILTAIGGAISGTLIWFLGNPDKPAIEWFEPAPSVLVIGCVGMAIWAFHRWQLLQAGSPDRNEALRFHDYVLAAVGLVAVVTGTALIVDYLFTAVMARSSIAESFEPANQLIGTLTLLSVGAGLWWRVWDRIETHRLASPAEESSSVWRKLYLALAAGIGGLTLAISATWIIFTVLRDLFDGALSSSTIEALVGPIGWLIAVLGAVWFHVGVWRSDRGILAAATPPAGVMPPPALPTAPTTDIPQLEFRWATELDHGELFTLHRARFSSTTAATESLEQFSDRTALTPTFIAVAGTRIMGAIGARTDASTLWLESLAVVPDQVDQQIDHQLVRAAIEHGKRCRCTQVRCVVSPGDVQSARLYTSLGFEISSDTASEQAVLHLATAAGPR